MSQVPRSGLTISHVWQHILSVTDSIVCQELYWRELLIGKCGCIAQIEIASWTSRDFTQNKLNSSVIIVQETQPRNLCARPALAPTRAKWGCRHGKVAVLSKGVRDTRLVWPSGFCYSYQGLSPTGQSFMLWLSYLFTPSATIFRSPDNNSLHLFGIIMCQVGAKHLLCVSPCHSSNSPMR